MLPGTRCKFVPVPPNECPAKVIGLPKCSTYMSKGAKCIADNTLPDGNTIYDVNNCNYTKIIQNSAEKRYDSDVFKCEGKCFENNSPRISHYIDPHRELRSKQHFRFSLMWTIGNKEAMF